MVIIGFVATARAVGGESAVVVEVAAAEGSRLFMKSTTSSKCSPNSSRSGDSDSGSVPVVPEGSVKHCIPAQLVPSPPGSSPELPLGSRVPPPGSLVPGSMGTGSSGLETIIGSAARIGRMV